METRSKKKTISLSFNDNENKMDCFVVNTPPVFMPANNLNGLLIDLTENDSPRITTKKSSRKVIELDMMLSNATRNPVTTTSSMAQAKNSPRESVLMEIDISNNNVQVKKSAINNSPQQPTSSIFLQPSTANVSQRPSTSTNIPCYENLLEMSKNNLISNAHDFVCSLCLNYVFAKQGVTLKYCLHSFCRPCLTNTIKTKFNCKLNAVKCPMMEEDCDGNIDDGEIKELVGVADYENFKKTIIEQKRKMEEDSLIPILLQGEFDDLDFIPNFQPFECSVCFTDTEICTGVILKNCLHKFCKECLIGCVEAAEDFEVKCPFIEDNTPCNEIIQEREIRSLVSAEVFEKHLQKSLKLAEHANELTFHCRTADCPGFVEIVGEEVTAFKCQVCQKINCVKCKAVHEGKSCVEHQEDVNPAVKDARLQKELFLSEDAIKSMVAKGEAMYCPRCQIPVIKVTGCDFITCTACKLGICWVTRKPRKDLKKADGTIVEGCKCREPPTHQRCHPKCGNCH